MKKSSGQLNFAVNFNLQRKVKHSQTRNWSNIHQQTNESLERNTFSVKVLKLWSFPPDFYKTGNLSTLSIIFLGCLSIGIAQATDCSVFDFFCTSFQQACRTKWKKPAMSKNCQNCPIPWVNILCIQGWQRKNKRTVLREYKILSSLNEIPKNFMQRIWNETWNREVNWKKATKSIKAEWEAANLDKLIWGGVFTRAYKNVMEITHRNNFILIELVFLHFHAFDKVEKFWIFSRTNNVNLGSKVQCDCLNISKFVHHNYQNVTMIGFIVNFEKDNIKNLCFGCFCSVQDMSRLNFTFVQLKSKEGFKKIQDHGYKEPDKKKTWRFKRFNKIFHWKKKKLVCSVFSLKEGAFNSLPINWHWTMWQTLSSLSAKNRSKMFTEEWKKNIAENNEFIVWPYETKHFHSP